MKILDNRWLQLFLLLLVLTLISDGNPEGLEGLALVLALVITITPSRKKLGLDRISSLFKKDSESGTAYPDMWSTEVTPDIAALYANKKVANALEAARKRAEKSGFLGMAGLRTDKHPDVSVKLSLERLSAGEFAGELVLIADISSKTKTVDRDQPLYLERLSDSIVEEFEAARGGWSEELQEQTENGGCCIRHNGTQVY